MLNTASYPKVHYPEVYILQGGYAEFYKKYPVSAPPRFIFCATIPKTMRLTPDGLLQEHCIGGYLPMDDPDYNATRVVELNAFRQQTRHFNRASSFTFGQAQSAAGLLKAATIHPSNNNRPPLARSNTLAPVGFSFPSTNSSTLSSKSTTFTSTSTTTMNNSRQQIIESTSRMSITEEEHDGDSSFGTNAGSSPGGGDGDSPCPTSKYKVEVGRHSLKIPTEVGGGRRVFARAQTAVSMFSR